MGTSGSFYSWNKEGSFDWYIANTGLNAVELNVSFYRFPFPVGSQNNATAENYVVGNAEETCVYLKRCSLKKPENMQRLLNLLKKLKKETNLGTQPLCDGDLHL